VKPIALDLFAAEGGATVGYQRAGFVVCAVDTDRARLARNPAEHKLAGDALDVMRRLGRGEPVTFDDGFVLRPSRITLVHMSPPCQGYTRGNAGRETSWPKLIPDCRDLAEELGLPYVIENVEDAGPHMKSPVGLCGCMFDLSTIDSDGIRIHLQRLRLFEANFPINIPRDCEGEGRARRNHPSQEWVAGAYGGARRDKYEAKYVRKGGYVPPDKGVVKRLLGIEHDVTWKGLFESLPPSYTEHIGRQLLEAT
jgi:DNA (cytosine-5)-methyltransferase 1